MANNTVPVELASILADIIKDIYVANNISNYYNATTLAEKTPSGTPDRLLQHIVELVLNVRSPLLYGYGAAMSDAERKDLYGDLSRHLQDAIDILTAIQAPLDVIYASIS